MKMLLRGMRADTEEAKEAIRLGQIRARKPKYPLVLLDEAAKVASEVGPTEASRLTGVHVESIKKHSQREKIKNGIPLAPRGPAKYPLELRQKVVADALRYMHFTRDKASDCFKRAATNNGLDEKAARTIRAQYQAGTLTA